jgi:hypothetical protein
MLTWAQERRASTVSQILALGGIQHTQLEELLFCAHMIPFQSCTEGYTAKTGEGGGGTGW